MTLDRQQLDRLDPVQANVLAILQAILELQTAPGSARQSLDPGLATEALVVTVAALVEATQDTGMEALAKRLGDKVVSYARAFRREHRASGQNGLQQLGAEAVERTAIN